MSCEAPKTEAKPTTSLNVENFIEGEATHSVVEIALKAVEQHREEFKAAGVTDIRVVPFVVDNMIAIEPVGGNREKSDAVVQAIANDLNRAAEQYKSTNPPIVELNGLYSLEASTGAIYRCPGSASQVVIDARSSAERTR